MMYVDIGQFIPRLHGEYMPLMSRRISLSITYDIWHECKHKVTCHNQYQTDTIHVHHPNPNEIVYEEEFEESDRIIACSVVDKTKIFCATTTELIGGCCSALFTIGTMIIFVCPMVLKKQDVLISIAPSEFVGHLCDEVQETMRMKRIRRLVHYSHSLQVK
eukprot:74435_1